MRGLELTSASREKLMIVLRDEPRFFGEFVRLNETWIRETFSPEDAALKAVSDPASILASGGHVFSAVEGEQVMGVGALIRSGPSEFELGRMTVEASFRGKGIGRALASAAIRHAEESGASRLFLLSNRRLSAAIALYHSLGFQIVSEGPQAADCRCDLQMEKRLASGPSE